MIGFSNLGGLNDVNDVNSRFVSSKIIQSIKC